MKKFLAFLLLLSVLLCSCGAFCEHQWENATCYIPKTCVNCGETDGKRLEHKFTDQTCAHDRFCTLCNAIGEKASGHSFASADCEAPKSCTVCGITEGEPLGHTLTEETVTEPAAYKSGTKHIRCENCDYSADEEIFAQKLSSREIYKMALERSCEINVKLKPYAEYSSAQGSDFLISADGLVVTNYHVIEDYASITVTINNNTHFVSEVVDYDRDIDLAVLKIDVKDAPFFKLANEGFAEGDIVYAFGSPIGFTSTITMGIISKSDRDDDGRKCIQHDASITYGNSGGPLINEYGEVIGVNTFIYTDSQNLNFAVAISELSHLKLPEDEKAEETEE